MELRQFELIAVEPQPQAGKVLARIFTAQEELPFAGHPVIGAAAALHERQATGESSRSWVFVTRIVVDNFEERLLSVGAKFVYVFDPREREGRTWDNAGAVEDVATGSAAGPAAAYLAAHGQIRADESVVIQQGRFLGRPSRIVVTPDSRGELWVGGPVAPVARGVLDSAMGCPLRPATRARSSG